MDALELILGLGRWGQTHRTEMLTGLIGLPLLLGGARLILGARQAATTTHGSARWATPREVRQRRTLWAAGRDPGAPRRAAAR